MLLEKIYFFITVRAGKEVNCIKTSSTILLLSPIACNKDSRIPAINYIEMMDRYGGTHCELRALNLTKVHPSRAAPLLAFRVCLLMRDVVEVYLFTLEQ